jgi:two-component system phosphate regulon sensor histidine kinase PhoR
MAPAWSSLLLRLVLLLAVGGGIGGMYGHPGLGLFAAAGGWLAWDLLNLYRLERWLRTGRLAEMPDGDGVWPLVFAKIEFIQERSRRRRRRWRQLVRELRTSAAAFPDGGVIVNARREILMYNSAARRLLGLKSRRDRGQRLENLIRHPDFIAYLEAGQFDRSVEIPGPTGSDTWLTCLLIPYGPEQSLLLIRDITPTVRLERMRRDFVANASHELRTPLTVIAGYLDALDSAGDVPESWQVPVTEMRQQAERMKHLLNDLLELSRLESSAPTALDNVVDVAALIGTARKELFAAPDRPQEVEVRVDSPVRLLGEERELQSIVSNLVSNAVRYTPAEGSVTIRWAVDEEGGHLSVADTGIGIAEEDLPRITERFYRTDRGRARQQGGTGLGLAIVKHALRRHDADLEVHSRLGEGSTFTCHFPPHRLALSSVPNAAAG